jgi:hypothetical protein
MHSNETHRLLEQTLETHTTSIFTVIEEIFYSCILEKQYIPYPFRIYFSNFKVIFHQFRKPSKYRQKKSEISVELPMV